MLKRFIIIFLLLLLTAGIVFKITDHKVNTITPAENLQEVVGNLKVEQGQYATSHEAIVSVSGKSLSNFDYKVLVDENLQVLASRKFLEDIIGCAVIEYPSGKIMVEQGNKRIEFELGRNASYADAMALTLASTPEKIDGELYIPFLENAPALGYSCTYTYATNTIDFTQTESRDNLPSRYDLRSEGRVTPVRDQGKYGTCWAFASLGALESMRMPMNKDVFSVNHMSKNNGYQTTLTTGGEHTMSMAYMAAWKGPVLDQDDPYGSNSTNLNADTVGHLQEAIILNDRDLRKIKNAIFKYGGLEACMYFDVSYGNEGTDHYNPETSAYYYDEEAKPNHDVVIVGWDDDFSRENFATKPKHDGAFLCKNSWGTDFGDKGYFYVSYDDAVLGDECIIYSKFGSVNDYDHNYQTDQLGWVGNMGFNSDTAYFSNVYTAKGNEILKAVSFYTTGANTSFTIYVVPEFKNVDSLNDRQKMGSGETRYPGYYTVNLNQDVELSPDQKYAVVVQITTPGMDKPIAIECESEDTKDTVDLTDGEGYVSPLGSVWHRAEESNCNICLKAFTWDRNHLERGGDDPDEECSDEVSISVPGIANRSDADQVKKKHVDSDTDAEK